MGAKKISENQARVYQKLFSELGADGLYLKIVSMGLMRHASNVKNADVEILDLSDAFFAAAKDEKNSDGKALFNLGKIMRRAAHALHRRIKTKRNSRFLSSV